ncbi:hypothetical protein Tco_0462913 [Tanacetum coccineum]
MTTPITTSTTDSQMHNNIRAAGSRDSPPMLATRRYAQWQSPVPATDDSPEVLKRTSVETILNMSPENKAHYESEKEAIHLLLTGIGDEIYSIVDACKTAHEMWIAIERLQQESMESYYSRFYKMMNEMIRNNLTVSTMQVNVQFLQQLQPERSRIAKNANPLALVDAAQSHTYPYYQAPKSHKPYAPTSKQSSSTRSNASTKFKGKEIAKPISPPSESASEEDSDPEQAQKDKEMQKHLALIAKYFKMLYKPTNNKLRTSSNSKNKNVEQSDWLADTDEEIDEQELEAHYSFMAKIQEVPTADSGTDTEPLEQLQNDAEYNVFFNTDQNAEDERAVLANLIANLKLDVDENKKIQKQLKKANASLAHELK